MDPAQRLQYIRDRITALTISDLKIMLRGVASHLINEANLLWVTRGDVLFVGDTHGDWAASQRAYQKFLELEASKLVFLGDYIDRGSKQIDNVNFLLYLKLLHRYRVLLLRGNHEVEAINWAYGFHDAVKRQFGKETIEVYELYNYVFSHLPVAGVTWNGVFFTHAGIPEHLDRVRDIDQLHTGTHEMGELTFELLWNDPKEKLDGFKKNRRRGGRAKYFGRQAFADFLARNDLQYVIRSHETTSKGVKYYFDGRLVSLFSSNAYSRRHKPKVAYLTRAGDLEILDL